MAITRIYPEYEVIRNTDRCIACRVCERQCANQVHRYDADGKKMLADESKCVNCHRCVTLCPTRALKIVKTDHTFRENSNWSGQSIQEIYRQAEAMLDGQSAPEAIVLASPEWHQGVVGIVASRMAEEFCCPTFLICLDGDKGKASSRSLECP